MRAAIGAAVLGVLAAPTGVFAQPSTRQVQEILELRPEARRFEVAAIYHEEQLLANGAEPGAAYAAHAGIGRGLDDYIVQLESYLDTSPTDEKLVPAVMDLLADLYLDRAQAFVGAAAYAVDDEGMDAYDGDHVVIAEAMAVELWERVASTYPDYGELGEVLRRLAAAYLDMAQLDDAKRALQQLLCGNRRSEIAAADLAQDRDYDEYKARLYADAVAIASYDSCVPLLDDDALIDEAWVSLGHVHRGAIGENDLAIAAFSRVVDDQTSYEYVGAAQELAASYVDNGMLIEAVPVLDELVLYLDESGEDDPLARQLRVESVQSLAHILARLWQESALPDQGASLKLATIYYHSGRNHQRHVRDVFGAFASALRAFGAYEQAIPVWRHTIDTWPVHPDTPAAYDKLIGLLIEKGDNAAADRERRHLLDALREGSAWHEVNAGDATVMAGARALGEQTLFTLASNEARQARLAYSDLEATPPYANDPRKKEAQATYASAVVLLEQFMADYPESEHAYDLRMALADTYYYSGRLEEAGRAYREVRDARAGGKHAEKAAFAATVVYEELAFAAVDAGDITLPPEPDAALLASAPEPIDIPEVVLELQRAYDVWVEYAPVMVASSVAVQAAEIDVYYLHLESAEKRLLAVLDQFCHSAEARGARERLVAVYRARGDDEAAARVELDFAKRVCGDSQPVRVVRSVKIERDYGAAEQAYNDGKFADAGRAFYDVHAATETSHAYHVESLFRAAEAMERAGDIASAVALWTEFTDDEARHVSPLYAEALLHEARAHRAAYDYEAAVVAYLELWAVAGDATYAPRAGFDLAAEALAGLWEAATLRELDRVYYDRGANDPGAATLFVRYATAVSDRVEAADAFLRAAAVFEKAGDPARIADTYREWDVSYSDFAGANVYRVRFHYRIAKALDTSGDRRGALKSFGQVVDTYAKVKSPGAADAELAGESQFWLAEQKFRMFDRYEFQWPAELSQKAVEAVAQPLVTLAEDAIAEFGKVDRFHSTWSIAAAVRMGDVAYRMGQKLADSPIPTSVGEDGTFDETILETFVDLVADVTVPMFEEGAGRWETAIAEATKRGTINEWSKGALERLNNYKPVEWPTIRDEVLVKEVVP